MLTCLMENVNISQEITLDNGRKNGRNR